MVDILSSMHALRLHRRLFSTADGVIIDAVIFATVIVLSVATSIGAYRLATDMISRHIEQQHIRAAIAPMPPLAERTIERTSTIVVPPSVTGTSMAPSVTAPGFS